MLLLYELDCDHIDDKGDQGEQHPRLLEANGVGRTAEGRVKANKEIRHQGAQHVIGTHWWNGIVVESPRYCPLTATPGPRCQQPPRPAGNRPAEAPRNVRAEQPAPAVS